MVSLFGTQARTMTDLALTSGLTPHGPDFRFIDRFERISSVSGIGWKYLSASAPYFADHFPGNPLMPAVLIVECAAQAAGVLVMEGSESRNTPLFLASIDQFRILGPVLPEEILETTVTLLKELGSLVIFEVECRVLEKIIARGRLMLSRQLAEQQT